LAYLDNLCLMTAISLLYRYADLVKVLGGTEWDLGWIVGLGMVGSLAMRFAQGVGIDHYGPRLVWICSTAAFSLVCLSHAWLTTAHGLGIYLLRVAFCTAVAGAFGSSTTFISSRVPVQRVAEVIGTLGTSGFIGMVLGTNLGDWICGPREDPTRDRVDLMFYVATALGVAAVILAVLATWGIAPPVRHQRPPLGHLWRRYHPGLLLLVGLTVGMGVGIPTTYLRPYTSSLGLPGIASFYTAYAMAAFAIRLLTRGWTQRFGIRPMVCLGLATLAVSMTMYLVVWSEWLLIVPAVISGMAHAFLFPSVVGGGSTSFPARYRGLGVTVMMSVNDLGTLIGAPLAAGILEVAKRLDWPTYPTMFTTIAIVTSAVCILYFAVGNNRRLGDDPPLDVPG